MSASKKRAQAPPQLRHRVSSLEVRVMHIEARLDSLAQIPAQMAELTTLVRSTLMQQQERIDFLDAQAMDKFESVTKAMNAASVSVNAVALSVDRLVQRLPCLQADPVIPCAEKESEQ